MSHLDQMAHFSFVSIFHKMCIEGGDISGKIPIPEVNMNVFCLAGKIVNLPELKETVNGTKTCTITLAVERQFANSDGIYETDLIQVEVWRGLAETVCNVCKENEWIGIKGRVASSKYEKNNHTYFNYSFIAEKISFMN